MSDVFVDAHKSVIFGFKTQEKNAKRHYSRIFFDTYLIRIIMSNMEEHVLIQIF